MKVDEIFGLLATVSFLLPLLLVLLFGLYVSRSLAVLALYCTFSAWCTATSCGLVRVPEPLRIASAAFINYTDAPLMLSVLLLYCHTPQKKNLVLGAGLLLVLYEGAIAFYFGLQPASSLYVSGAGLLLVFVLGVYFFTAQLKQTIRFNKGMGRTLIAAAIFFGYGLYLIVYCLHYVFRTPDTGDIFLLYYFASIVFSVLASAGLVFLYLRHRQLKELMVVRRELREFFQY